VLKAHLVLAELLGFVIFLANSSRERYSSSYMETKAAELAALLEDKIVFYVNIEQPDNHGSTTEITIEDSQGISFSVEGDIITFSGDGKIASFTMLENAQIIANRTDEELIISTFAENGGLQVKSKKTNLWENINALQNNFYEINKFFIKFDRMNGLAKIMTPPFAFPTVPKEVSSFFDKNSRLLAQISPAQLNTFHELVNPFKSILDSKFLVHSDLGILADRITTISPALTVLSRYFSSYDNIIFNQKEALTKILYLRPSEKKMLLRHEKCQKKSLILGSDDLENTNPIISNVENTIGFVNTIAQIENQDSISVSIVENLEKELCELLSSHGEGYLEILKGAKQASHSDNPDKVRHTITSLRELTTRILHDLSPDEKIIKWSTKKEDFVDSRPTRKCRVAYIFRSLEHSTVSPLIENDISFIVNLFNIFNKGTHKLIPESNSEELDYLITKIESTLLLLLKYSLKE
jgi:hypothetical protein